MTNLFDFFENYWNSVSLAAKEKCFAKLSSTLWPYNLYRRKIKNWEKRTTGKCRKKDCWQLMRSCGNFVVIWFHCKFLHSWMVNFQEGIYWTDRAFNSAWANTLPFCLVTKLAKEKEKEKKIITTSNSLRILTQWKMFTSNFLSSKS